MANKKNEIITMKVDEFNTIINRINTNINAIENGYMGIAGDVLHLYNTKAYMLADYQNIYDMCNDLYGMARGTVSNIINVAKRYFDANYQLKEEWKGYSFSALVMMWRYSDEEIKAIGVTPEMSRRETKATIESYFALPDNGEEDTSEESVEDTSEESVEDTSEESEEFTEEEKKMLENDHGDIVSTLNYYANECHNVPIKESALFTIKLEELRTISATKLKDKLLTQAKQDGIKQIIIDLS